MSLAATREKAAGDNEVVELQCRRRVVEAGRAKEDSRRLGIGKKPRRLPSLLRPRQLWQAEPPGVSTWSATVNARGAEPSGPAKTAAIASGSTIAGAGCSANSTMSTEIRKRSGAQRSVGAPIDGCATLANPQTLESFGSEPPSESPLSIIRCEAVEPCGAYRVVG